MATDPGTIGFLLDQLGTRGTRFTTRRMFGEYCLYREGRPVALVCDDVLFVKDTAPGREAMAGVGEVEFGAPFPGARPHLRLPPDLWDDGDALRRLLDATAAALPMAKQRKPAGPAATTKRASEKAGNAPGSTAKRVGRTARDTPDSRPSQPKPGDTGDASRARKTRVPDTAATVANTTPRRRRQ